MAEPVEVTAPPDTDTDTEGSKLEAMAAKLDAGEGSPQIEAQVAPEVKPTPEPEKPEGEQAPPAEEKKPGAARERGPDGKFLPAKKDEAPVEGQVSPKVDSEFEKAKKEHARQENLLKNFETEKAQVRAKAEELRQREQELAAYAAQNRPEATLHGYTGREYMAAVEEFRKNGDHENALKALEAATQLANFEAQYYSEHESQANDARFNSQMDKVLNEHAELKDPESPESKAVVAVLSEFPEIYYLDNGFAKAHKIAKRLMKADSVEDLQTKLTAAEAELTKLREATTPSIGGPSTPAGTKKFNQMSPKEQEDFLERKAGELDQQAA